MWEHGFDVKYNVVMVKDVFAFQLCFFSLLFFECKFYDVEELGYCLTLLNL